MTTADNKAPPEEKGSAQTSPEQAEPAPEPEQTAPEQTAPEQTAPEQTESALAEPTTTEKPVRSRIHHGIRLLWVLIGAIFMGGIAIGVVYLVQTTKVIYRISDPELRFWTFQLGCGLGYLIGGFLVAVLSPGRTTREPMYAAVLAYIGQTVFLLVEDLLAIHAWVFIGMLVLDGALAYLGAWIGEKVTGAE